MTSNPTQAASLTGVSRLYGSFAALRNISLEIRAGECVMVLGENGAGKSTLLRMLAGLIQPTLGAVQVLGDEPEASRSRIGYMSHAPMLYDELTAMENLLYFEGLYTQQATCKPCNRNAERVLTAVGLDPKLERPVSAYSQGMRQRASLARAILSDPEVLLLDEPFSNLDAAGAAQMVTLLSEFRSWPLRGTSSSTQRASTRTIILTTHQPQLAEALADRIITMRAGQIASVTERA